jgi:competence protein ComEC
VTAAVDAVRRHPRHLILFALTAGLLVGPVAPAVAWATAAVAAWLAGRLPLAVFAAVAVLAGATLAQARVDALSAGELPSAIGRSIDTRAILLEPIRVRRNGSAVARVRLAGRATLGGAGRGEMSADADEPSSGAEDASGVQRGAEDASAVQPGAEDSSGVQPGAEDSSGVPSGAEDVSGVQRGAEDASDVHPGAAIGMRALTDDLTGEIAVARGADGRLPPGVRVGSELRMRGSVAPLGDFDAYQRLRGARAAIEVASWEPTGGTRGGLLGALDGARERAARGLGTGLAEPQAALLRGMVLGQDEAIAQGVRDDFKRSGLAHLLAVSGQNVLLLCTLVLAACAVLDVPLRARLIAAGVLVALYVPLAGGGPSIQRAGVMGIAGLVAALAGRPASRWYALGLAAAVTLAVNPLAAGDPGWQLSFAAVVGLLALARPLRHALTRCRVPELVADVAAITVAATLATAPLMALHFEQVSLASLPANLLAAPVVAPVMWLGMLGIALAQVAPPLAGPLNVLCAPLLGYLEWVAHGAAGAPLAAVPVRLEGSTGLALAYAVPAASVLVLFRLRRAWPRIVATHRPRPLASAWAPPLASAWAPPLAGREPLAGEDGASARLAAELPARTDRLGSARVRVAVLVTVATLVAAVVAVQVVRTRPAPLAPGEFVVSFLDVGQGDAVLLQRDGTSILVDTGPPGGPILQRLAEAGVDRLDLLVLTHAEADHEGMALSVIAAHRPRMVLDGGAGWPTAVQRGLPDALARIGGRAVAARAGQVLRLGPVKLRVLWPPAPAPGWRPDGDANDRAVVAHVQDGAFDLLLPADAETNVTAGLDLPRVEALKVAHHGSVDEGLPAMLERTSPQVAAIEVGRNSYGHPAPSTLDALRVVPELVRTDRDGTVRLHVAGGQMRLEGGSGS